MKIIDAIWFSTMQGPLGVVLGEDEVTGDHKAYIGRTHGINEELDTKQVAMLGSPIYYVAARHIADWLEDKKEGG